MSHINRVTSSFCSDSSDSTQRWPQMPKASIRGRSSRPRGVSWYSNTAGSFGEAVRRTMSAASRSFSRWESSAGDMRGTPRRRSLNRVEPAISSRSTTMVQRGQRISAAIATGQNWL